MLVGLYAVWEHVTEVIDPQPRYVGTEGLIVVGSSNRFVVLDDGITDARIEEDRLALDASGAICLWEPLRT